MSNSNDYYYNNIVSTMLKIDKCLDKYNGTIYSRLHSAYQIIQEKHKDHFSQSDIFGINRCVHLASSVVLLCTEAELLLSAVENIRIAQDEDTHTKLFPEKDATTVLTIATLFYILNNYSHKLPADEQKTICKHFDTVNWMIGNDAMRILGISPISKQSSL